MGDWLIPLAVFLLIGGTATFYIRKVRLPREEAAAGIASLTGMRWREFIHLVLAAMANRGYGYVPDPDAGGDEVDYELERDGKRYLLSSKHGASYVLGSSTIAEFANAIRMKGAAGGLLVTPGQFAPEAAPLAAAQRIELLDGPTLWPELQRVLPPEQRLPISTPAQAHASRHLFIAWCGAFVIGLAVFVLGGDNATEEPFAAAPAPAIAPSPDVPAGASAATAPAIPSTAADAPGGSPARPDVVPTDPAQLERRRTEVARAISTLSMVDRALWSTQSTLLVHLTDMEAEPKSAICPLLERYSELGASRVQLQPPQGSERPVRFFQCRAF